MPDYIKTEIKADGMHKILQAITSINKDGNDYIDFHKIIPMPKHIFRGDLSDKDKEIHGKNNCWYDWSIFNRGTKWEASDSKLYKNKFSFATARNHPMPIIRELSKIFPKTTFEVCYYEEFTKKKDGTKYKIKDLEIIKD